MPPAGFVLPPPPRAAGFYRPVVVANGFAFLSGFGPRAADGGPVAGIVGGDMTVETARAHAREVGLLMLAALVDTLGTLDRIRQVMKVTGMINAAPGFGLHPRVLDGCSEVLVEALGSRGEHARAAYGVASLPFGTPLSIEAVCLVAD
ncbi:RidA family protein [Prosthecomicrobium pneumaticum]|uniref:Enamine deaminase RidA (YjgF/YER057c/UK114 family) n=1 Tax=Prosthecomicrobium pneumaticum TaxID=81895 RepID=A0A7W9L2K2_9HYPH|nr:RidA family protein [Prosthecomicrobium pneumaticum]MBB5753579.1 enamine deaminase RidA (YjgF/YER057c/UK114 family) [Prosthecomicrobium pneumaticum]